MTNILEFPAQPDPLAKAMQIGLDEAHRNGFNTGIGRARRLLLDLEMQGVMPHQCAKLLDDLLQEEKP